MAWAKSCVSMQVFGGPVVPQASPRLTKMHNDKVKIMLGYHAGPNWYGMGPNGYGTGEGFWTRRKGSAKMAPTSKYYYIFIVECSKAPNSYSQIFNDQ